MNRPTQSSKESKNQISMMLLAVIFFLCYLSECQCEVHLYSPRHRLTRELHESLANSTVPHAFVLLGATGDLAKREIYPALWHLYRYNLLPPKTRFIGYATKSLTVADIRKGCEPFINVEPDQEKLYDAFWEINSYVNGTKDSDSDYKTINKLIENLEDNGIGNRIFYMAIPPSVFPSAATQINRYCMAKNGFTRVVIEKPFGEDLESSEKLSSHLTSLFSENQIYRNDHFLGYEVVQNILTLRFANHIFTSIWNKDNIASVEILFEENFGVEGRGGYFDKYGIIRDVMQNHLLQILSLIAMEIPQSVKSSDIRNAKVELLKQTKEIVLDDVVIGQYVGNPDSKDAREKIGYREDPTVPINSTTSTFALTVLKINNDRWRGIPFIIRAGKGLGLNRTCIIIQFKDIENNLFNDQPQRNEIVFQIGNSLELKTKIMSKVPGISTNISNISLDFNYQEEYKNLTIPSAYQKLILNIFEGSSTNFVRTDELREAWRIFTPILHKIENDKMTPIEYKFGSRGPTEADEIEKKYGFKQYD